MLSPDLTRIIQGGFLGGSRDDYAYTLTIHPTTGDVYVAGETGSSNFSATEAKLWWWPYGGGFIMTVLYQG
jgi:hypothetical protein